MIKEAMLYEKLDSKVVHCFLCAHHCKIAPNKFGICGVRENIGGRLNTLVYAQAIAIGVDPIEKKPLYHFLPGSKSYSIATPGCNFKCGFCQNWQISQVDRKEISGSGEENMPEAIVREAKKNNCKSISYTYTEPTIFFEYALDCAKLARASGLKNIFVTNGFMTREALEAIHPYLDAANVDLKSFSDDFYKNTCKARLGPVLDSIRLMRKLNIWVEVTTLAVPGLNDSDKELGLIAQFIASVGVEIPWHISRFHPDFQLTEVSATPLETLRRAREIGLAAGLRYVYMGNVFEGNDTYCYNCKSPLIQRQGFAVAESLIRQGKCPHCDSVIDGLFA